ncbi:MAG: ABC transporter permease [Leptospirales bacterium]|jgi:peptide/nickel transport system permease protein
MGAYTIRRLLYFVPVWFGVFLITFGIFHLRDPLTLAAVQLPQAPIDRLQSWVRNHNYHLPRFVNVPSDATTERADGRVHPEFAKRSVFYSQFFLSVGDLLRFDLGMDRTRKPIAESLRERIGPTLSIMAPALFLTTLLSLAVALFSAYLKGTVLDRTVVFAGIAMLSVALPVYILAAQYVFGRVLPVVPIYGHVLLPIFIAVFAAIGGQIRFYRSVFLEQMALDYVRTARAKGVPEARILSDHILRNSWIPILTQVALSVPFLITGSVLLEQFFGVPGMGDLLYSALVGQDFQVIKVLVYLGSFFYMVSALLTDLLYAVVDPRISF